MPEQLAHTEFVPKAGAGAGLRPLAHPREKSAARVWGRTQQIAVRRQAERNRLPQWYGSSVRAASAHGIGLCLGLGGVQPAGAWCRAQGDGSGGPSELRSLCRSPATAKMFDPGERGAGLEVGDSTRKQQVRGGELWLESLFGL